MITLKNKNVLIVGLGRFPEGSGAASVRYALAQGARVTVTDKKSKDDLQEQIASLGKFAVKITWKLGFHAKEDFESADIIIQNPAVPDHLPELAVARKKGIPIHNDITLFLESYAGPVLGVTGTRGKSTTAALLWDMVKRKDPTAQLGGNIGNSPLSFAGAVKKTTPVILELSSWLLARLPTIQKSPHIAVVTNFFPDHLNAYCGDIAQYQKDKEQIVRFQTADDCAVLNADDPVVRRFEKFTSARVDWFSDHAAVASGGVKRGSMLTLTEQGEDIELVRTADLLVPGAHFVRNSLAASVAAWRFGVDPSDIRESLRTFAGLPHRLQEIANVGGIRYIDDSTATMPEALIAGIVAIAELVDRRKKIILIAGGNSKELSYKGVHAPIKRYVKKLLLVPGTATDQFPKGDIVADLETAFREAHAKAVPGDIILFSPGATWLPNDLDEFARGERFTTLVHSFTSL